ncbi:MAG: TolC family protein [Lentisphaerales bacterium]|nr:TolC family protein [Lentisphaerales bacterium]
MNTFLKALSGTIASIFLVSCQSYTPLKLESEKLLEEVNTSRQQTFKEELSFELAAKLMSQRNFQLKLVAKEYEKLQQVAKLKTPLPNPELEAGPAFGSRLEDTTASSTQPFIGIGISLPIGPRLARNDDLNKAKELQAYNNTIIQHRLLYFQLRQAYINYMLAQQKLASLNTIEETMQLTRKITKRLIEVGTSTKLGLYQVDLQLAEMTMKKFEFNSELNEALGQLSRLLGLNMASLQKMSLKVIDLPELNLNLADQQRVMLDNNSHLTDIEMQFHLADYELKLELAQQYPDLKIGITGENEVGEKNRTISVPFSIKLPVFDRNQQAISAAFSEREIKIAEYKNELNRQLSFLEEEMLKFNFSSKKSTMLNAKIIPLSDSNIKDAEKALKLGSVDILQYLDLLVQHQTYKLTAVELQKNQWQHILTIERISGLPIINFINNEIQELNIDLTPLEVEK